jgi:predicted TPR repeat methyltransferase
MRDPLDCVDLIATRRYAYARSAAKEGDWLAAAEVLEQALERAPDWPPALFSLGEARQKLGDCTGAAEAFGACLAADPLDAQGAAARLALLGFGEAPPTLPKAYVRRLFDDYAPRFERSLTEGLGYRGPALIEVAPARRFVRGLDLGCGTGLAGAAIRARVDRLSGVDLSAGMIARARASGLYDELAIADIVEHLRCFETALDLIVAADVLIYVGDLSEVFSACGRALASGGLFAFTIETFSGEGFELGETMRYSHARAYIEAMSARAAMRPVAMVDISMRREAGEDVASLVCVLAAEPK